MQLAHKQMRLHCLSSSCSDCLCSRALQRDVLTKTSAALEFGINDCEFSQVNVTAQTHVSSAVSEKVHRHPESQSGVCPLNVSVAFFIK